MQDTIFIEQFENTTLSPQNFHHKDHVRLAWLYLNRYPLLEALQKFSNGLKNFARSLGKEQLYHETITWAYIFLINERMVQADTKQSWEEFIAGNGDLLNWQETILNRYYSKSVLDSPLAKSIFLLPNKFRND